MSDATPQRRLLLYALPVALLLSAALVAAFVALRQLPDAPTSTSTPLPTHTPASAVPADLLQITLVPYETERFRSVHPQGWRAADGGAYAYADTDIGVVQRHIPAPGIGFVEPGIEEDMPFVQHAGQVDERTFNGLTWRIYRGDTDEFRVDYALADGGVLSVYMVLMQVPPDAYNVLHERLFLATLEQFTPR